MATAATRHARVAAPAANAAGRPPLPLLLSIPPL